MTFLGQVITNNTKDAKSRVLGFIKVLTPDLCFDASIPTLIVGHDLADSMYGKENIHVLDRKVDDNVYWTFSRNEKRNEYEKDIKSFNDRIYKEIKNSIRYKYVDIFTSGYSSLKEVINIVKNSSDVINYCYLSEKHLYFLHGDTVYGLSLNDTEYIGIDDDKVFSLIKNNPSTVVINDNSFLTDEMLRYIGDEKVIIPYLFSLNI